MSKHDSDYFQAKLKGFSQAFDFDALVSLVREAKEKEINLREWELNDWIHIARRVAAGKTPRNLAIRLMSCSKKVMAGVMGLSPEAQVALEKEGKVWVVKRGSKGQGYSSYQATLPDVPESAASRIFRNGELRDKEAQINYFEYLDEQRHERNTYQRPRYPRPQASA